MQVLFHVDSANVGSLPLFISEEEDGDRILLSVGDKYLHKLKKDGPAFKKEGSFSLPANVLSVSSGCSGRIAVSLQNGCIMMSNWKELFSTNQRNKDISRKRKLKDEGTNEDDIFSLLLDETPPTLQPRLQNLFQATSDFVQIASIPTGYSVISTKLFDNFLIAFCVPTDNTANQICLILWRLLIISNDDTPKFIPSPTMLVSHEHKCKVNCHGNFPPVPSALVTCERNERNAVCINETLYSYLFGHENLLSKAPIVLYGWTCGCVLAASLRLSGKDNALSPRLVCILDQPIVSIHSFGVGQQSLDVHNSVMFVGAAGKIVLFVAYESNVKHYELFVTGPILSAVFVNDVGLFYSSLNAVQKVCLRKDCLMGGPEGIMGRAERTNIFRAFESPLTISSLSVFLLQFFSNDSTFVAVTLDGRVLCLVVQEPSSSIPSSHSGISDSIKNSLLSIQSSSDCLTEMERDTNLVDVALVSLNETMSLFRQLSLENNETPPFKVSPEIVYEQTGVDCYAPQLELLLVYRGSRPLRKGLALIIEVTFDKQSADILREIGGGTEGDKGMMFSHVVPLGGLQGQSDGNKLRLRPKIPFHFYSSSRLRISCWCSYSLPIAGSLQKLLLNIHEKEKDVAMIHFYHEILTPLDFMFPLKNISSRQTDHTHKIVSFTIRPNTLSKIANLTTTDILAEPLHPTLLSHLISHSQLVRQRIEGLILQVSSGCGLELRAVFSSQFVCIQLLRKADSGCFEMIVSSNRLESAVLLCDDMVQRIQKQSGQLSEHRRELLQKVCKKFSLSQELHEQLKKYFQGLCL